MRPLLLRCGPGPRGSSHPRLVRCRTACPRAAGGGPGGDWTPRGGRGCFRAPRAVPMRVRARPSRKRRAPCSRPLPLPRELVGGSARGRRAAAFGRETATLGWPRICGLRPEVRPARTSPAPTARAQLPVPPGPGRGPSPQVRPVHQALPSVWRPERAACPAPRRRSEAPGVRRTGRVLRAAPRVSPVINSRLDGVEAGGGPLSAPASPASDTPQEPQGPTRTAGPPRTSLACPWFIFFPDPNAGAGMAQVTRCDISNPATCFLENWL